MIRRALIGVALAFGLAVAGPALAASAAPVATAGPVATKACAPAPEPASPFAALSGKFYGEPATASDGDPFANGNVKIADVYGYSYQWANYDNGCLPGSAVLPQAQTDMANVLLGGSASISAFTHGLFSLVVTPDFLAPLDGVLTSATSAIKGGFWDPWVSAILILVAAGTLIAATRAEVSSAVTTVGWAVLVLVGATYVMSYPVSSARAVDELVQTTVATSARAIGATNETSGPPAADTQARESTNPAQAALDDMFDTINRDTFYEAWLEGTLGSSDSAVARAHGPDLFRASHLSWSEAEIVKDDPDAGQAIIEAKKALWVTTAAAVERADSAAYQQLTGNNGRWDAAATVALRVALMMPFLVVAAVFMVVAYVATRVFVPLAPAFGVLGLLYATQDWVIDVLKQVGRFIILGPAFFVAALANLLLDTAVLDSDIAFGLKLVIVAAVPFVLFKLLRPGRAVPGSRAARRMARFGLGTLLNASVTRRAVREGVDDAQGNDGAGATPAHSSVGRDPNRVGTIKSAPVATGDTLAITAGSRRPRELPSALPRDVPEVPVLAARSQPVDRSNELPIHQPEGRTLTRRTRRELAAIGGGPEQDAVTSRPRETFTAAADSDTAARVLPPATSASGRGRDLGAGELLSHPATRPDERDVDLAAPVDKSVPRGELIGRSTELPTGIVEATTRYDAEGNPVFEIWRPPTTVHTDGDGPEELR
ncbi:hypothetical protein [Cellulomonas xylanilytica]|uniref:TrbL/VirB6 plasmid conjugal transfer protein n=1 Tax=Cellulomonas xylanilytica TaxID=233583 RepID=A0A510V399_9CELL|nr:hypothetical protein [Cellulomonas xylanilytica]GEK21367.1 hypothetical protein CXY01_18870 [Cellulomonas xylanilytica]